APGPFSLVTSFAIGNTELYDMDLDGRLDVVGGRGAIVTADLELVTLAPWPAASEGRPGRFDADELPDVAWGAFPDEGIVVYPGDGGDAIATVAPAAADLTVADLDGDAIDDLAFHAPNSIEVWRGNADGVFTPLATVGDSESSLPTFTRFAGTSYLAY